MNTWFNSPPVITRNQISISTCETSTSFHFTNLIQHRLCFDSRFTVTHLFRYAVTVDLSECWAGQITLTWLRFVGTAAVWDAERAASSPGTNGSRLWLGPHRSWSPTCSGCDCRDRGPSDESDVNGRCRTPHTGWHSSLAGTELRSCLTTTTLSSSLNIYTGSRQISD